MRRRTDKRSGPPGWMALVSARRAVAGGRLSVRRRSRRAGVAATVGVLAIVVAGAVVGARTRSRPRHTRAGDRHPAAVGDRPVGGGRRHAPGALRARTQPRADDPRRHQHLGAARARLDRGRRHRPRPARRGAPRRRAARRRGARRPGGRRRCSPTGTTTTPRRPRGSPSSPAPGCARSGAVTTTWATATC